LVRTVFMNIWEQNLGKTVPLTTLTMFNLPSAS
jgi:hypothetical protein